MKYCAVNFKKCLAVLLLSLAFISPICTTSSIAYADDGAAAAPYRLMTDDVLDTYRTYTCPNGISSHNMTYNQTYKTITFKTGYKRTGATKEHVGSAKNCSCGSGAIHRFVVTYHTW